MHDFKMIRLVFVSSILVAVSSLPHSYHHVKFITPSERLESSPWKPVIPPRSYSYSWSSGPSPANRLWSVGNFHLPAFPSIGHQFEFPHVGQAPQGFFGQQQQLQPNFNNEIEVRDPYLLTGAEGYNAVKFLYRKPLFFGDYPHVRAILRNQILRRENHLEGHRLSSARIHSPFYRE